MAANAYTYVASGTPKQVSEARGTLVRVVGQSEVLLYDSASATEDADLLLGLYSLTEGTQSLELNVYFENGLYVISHGAHTVVTA